MRLRRGEWEFLVVVDVDVDDDVVNNNMMNDTTLHDVYEQEKKKRKVGEVKTKSDYYLFLLFHVIDKKIPGGTRQ